MEVAAGITGFVCAVGQACQAAAQLHTFFASITDAPSRITQLSEKLDALHSVLRRINDVSTSLDAECGVEVPADVELALKRTVTKLEGVKRVVRKLDVNIERDGRAWKVKRSWMKVKWAFKEDDMGRICADLEAEKSGLALALQSLSLTVDAISLKHMEGLQMSMAGLMQHSKTHTELVKSHVDDRFVSLERSLNTISGHIEKANTQNMLPEEIMSMIQATVTKSVQEAMTKAMLTGTTPSFGSRFTEEPFAMSRESTWIGGEEMRREYSGSTLTGSTDEETWKDWERWPEERNDVETVCVEPIDKVKLVDPESIRSSSKQIGSSLKYRHYRRVPTSLGLLLMFYTASSSSMNRDDPGYRLSTAFEMGFTFIPASWLFTTAFSASFTKTTRFAPSPSNDMNINFKSFNVVPTTADVMVYSRLGDTLKLQELLSQRVATPNDRDIHGRTPLHWAAAMGHFSTCALLLQAGADPTTPNEMARTPLHWTTFLSCHPDVIRLLISHGCDPDIPNIGGQSSLFSTGGADFAAVLDAMLNQDKFMVDIDQPDNWGRTPLMWVVGNEKEESLESIRALVKAGASVTKVDKQGLTPLHLCMLSANPGLKKKQSMIALLRAGADPRAASQELGGLTVTDVARYNGLLETWREALEACRLDLGTVMKKGASEDEAVIATAIGRVKRNVSVAEENEMNAESVLKRRKMIVEVDDDGFELDQIKRSKIDEIPRRIQYQLFEGGPADDSDFNLKSPKPTHALEEYQAQLMVLEKQNVARLYKARAEQDSISAESGPLHTYHTTPFIKAISQRQPVHPLTQTNPVQSYRTAHQPLLSNFDFDRHLYHPEKLKETMPVPSYSPAAKETMPSPSYSPALKETMPSPSYSLASKETSPSPSCRTTKIQCNRPPERRDDGLSYSTVPTSICKSSMKKQESCQPIGGSPIPIRNSFRTHKWAAEEINSKLAEYRLKTQHERLGAMRADPSRASLGCRPAPEQLKNSGGIRMGVPTGPAVHMTPEQQAMKHDQQFPESAWERARKARTTQQQQYLRQMMAARKADPTCAYQHEQVRSSMGAASQVHPASSYYAMQQQQSMPNRSYQVQKARDYLKIYRNSMPFYRNSMSPYDREVDLGAGN